MTNSACSYDANTYDQKLNIEFIQVERANNRCWHNESASSQAYFERYRTEAMSGDVAQW